MGFEARFFKVGDASVFTSIHGLGTPMVLLHGNPDSGDMWDPVVDRLAGRFRCIRPDLPGLGRSMVPPDFDYSLSGMAAHLEGLCRALELHQPVHLVVHDFGGPFGLAWAAAHPERIRTITCLNTVFFADYDWHFWARVWRTPVMGEVAMAVWNRPLIFWQMRRGSAKVPDHHVRFMYIGVSRDMRKNVLRLYRESDPAKFESWERRYLEVAARKPVQVIWGERDPYIPARFAHRLGAREVRLYPEYGHWISVEAPDIVARHILEFCG
ncbi:MAG: alpha/beta fold hydrolase [Desulfatibacillaceae bacterium]